MARRNRDTRLAAPFLKRIFWREPEGERPKEYPFTLPFLRDPDWELEFAEPVTILVGENGVGKSTVIEAIASLGGFDQAGGSRNHLALDHSRAQEGSGGDLAQHLRAGWLPKVTEGWFFRAETLFSVARYLDDVGSPMGGYLNMSHGEGFLRIFEERCSRQGLYLLDEPESALSPSRQLDLLAMLARIQDTAKSQVIMATHSPILMALPGARLMEVSRFGVKDVRLDQTRHFRLYDAFIRNPSEFVAGALEDRALRRAIDEE
jgi:predicted ATPase